MELEGLTVDQYQQLLGEKEMLVRQLLLHVKKLEARVKEIEGEQEPAD